MREQEMREMREMRHAWVTIAVGALPELEDEKVGRLALVIMRSKMSPVRSA
jgi:hypothetical protein